MKQKKKIDDIYREGLKNAHVPPPADSWEFISTRLPQEKKKRVLPLWIPLAGVAALVALLISIFNFNLFDTSAPEPFVNQEENFRPNISPAAEITPEAEPGITHSENKEQEDLSIENTSEAVASESNSYRAASKIQNNGKVPNAVEAKAEKKLLSQQAIPGAENTTTADAAVAETSKETLVPGEGTGIKPAITSTPAEALAETPDASKMQNTSAAVKKDLTKELLKEEAELAEAETAAPSAKNEGFLKRIRISTTAGAVYFNMGSSNTVDSQMAGNTGGSDVSMSYGVNLAYQVSEKVKIRSGVSKVNFNYSTRQVDYNTASSSSAVRTDPAGMGIMLASQGDLEQEFGFVEIPLEVEFALLDKKIGLNLIGGASTLLLGKNNLVMNTPAFTTDFGGAQNLNEVSFSANLGLGVNYKFTPKIRLNLEPMFKYQLNTFDTGNSHYFGIYSGLSYQF